jgi:hypothetical protein
MFGLGRKMVHPAGDEHPAQQGFITIALGMPVPVEERNGIAAVLGAAYRVVDICEAPLDTAVVVVGPCSAGAIRALTRTFPDAEVLVVEREASTTTGPVSSALRAGATAYVVTGTEHNQMPASHAA